MYEQEPVPVCEMVRKQEDTYIRGVTTISKYVQFSMHDTIEQIEGYLNSKHISGQFDSLGREKPFFNIVTAAANIWFRSTDIDESMVKVRPTRVGETLIAFLATVKLQDWMRRENFGAFLNDWGRVLSRYGSAVVKFVEKGGRLMPSVTAWNRLIVDSVDFDNNVKIEVLEYTEAQLRQNESYDQDMVEALCESLESRKTLDKKNKDIKADYIRVYEVHGVMPISYVTDKESDQDRYAQQMHVISFVRSKNYTKRNGEYDDFTLYRGREKQEPNMITHLIKEDGRTLSIGAVEHLFEPQWMTNHSAKAIKDQLDLASKIIFQTADKSFVNQNALTSIEQGDILIHDGSPLEKINNQADITGLESFSQMWKALGNEIVGISESMLGNAAPSGTAWRQVETLLQENHSLFELMTENKGLYVIEMLRRYVIPFIKKDLDNSDEISAVLDEFDIQKIDAAFVKNEGIRLTNKKIIDKALNNEITTPDEQNQMMQSHVGGIQEAMAQMGNTRYFKPSDLSKKTWAKVFEDLEWKLDIDVTGEDVDQNMVTTLNTMLMTIARNPMILQDPNAKIIFNKILTATGAMSPLELSNIPPAQPQQPLQQQTAPAQVGG